jgi:hypothetical protein
MNDGKAPIAKDDLSKLQGIVWKAAAAVEIVCIALFGRKVTGFDDPVVLVVFFVVIAACVWLTRIWVKTSITDEMIYKLMGRS